MQGVLGRSVINKHLTHHPRGFSFATSAAVENVTLVARRTKLCRGFLAISLVAQLPPKEVF